MVGGGVPPVCQAVYSERQRADCPPARIGRGVSDVPKAGVCARVYVRVRVRVFVCVYVCVCVVAHAKMASIDGEDSDDGV